MNQQQEFALAVGHFQSGRWAEAEAVCRGILAAERDHPDSVHMLGLVSLQTGRVAEAVEHLRKAVILNGGVAQLHYNLALACWRLGAAADAERHYREALRLAPAYPQALINLAVVLSSTGRAAEAFGILRRVLAVQAVPEARSLYVEIALIAPELAIGDPGMLLRALSEPWARPSDLAGAAIQAIKASAALGPLIRQAADAWPERPQAESLFGHGGFSVLAAEPLLRPLLETALIRDLEMERFFTCTRRALLFAAMDADPVSTASNELAPLCALARQCFINEYVYSALPDEVERADALRQMLGDAIRSGASVAPMQLAAAGVYFPLHTLDSAPALLKRNWGEPVRALLAQQIEQPLHEMHRRPSIAALTKVEDDISLLVQRQYEESPYPTWVKAEPPDQPITLDQDIRKTLPLASFRPSGKGSGVDILIAGCGSGQHLVEVAQKYRGARVLAVDLSRASLAYAERQAASMGVAGIEFAQGDILNLLSLGSSFDLIESIGVLHHMRDPRAGWRVLVSLLRPEGVMRIGLYSRIARRSINAARQFAAGKGYAPSPAGIRQARQDLMTLDQANPAWPVVLQGDFYSMSACRDLLFHVHEHQYSLPEIKGILEDLKLNFLGFSPDHVVLQRYRKRFPEDAAATDLERWHRFEAENPDTFIAMYQFVVQRQN